MAQGGLQMNAPMRATPYQGQLQQAQMDNLVFNNELNSARSMMNQLGRFMPNPGANMLVPNLGAAANFAQNTRAPSAAPRPVHTDGTLEAPVEVPDDDIIPDPVPSTSAGKHPFPTL